MKTELKELQSILQYFNDNVHSSPSGGTFDDLFYVLSEKNTIKYKGQLNRHIDHLIRIGYLIKENNHWYNITTEGILFFRNGGYNASALQKFNIWKKKGENMMWVIGLIVAIILALLGLIL